MALAMRRLGRLAINGIRHRAFSSSSSPEAKIVRILQHEIDTDASDSSFQIPHRSIPFSVSDRRGEQWIVLRRDYGDEKIKVEATMIGLESADAALDDNICLSVTIFNSKHSDDPPLVFGCFVNPHKISIDNVFIPLPSSPKPYSGPPSSKMSKELRTALEDFLKERGIDDNFSGFLFQYLLNKTKTEYLSWLNSLKALVQK